MICISNSTNGHAGPPGSAFVPDQYLHTVGLALTVLLTDMRDHKG
jgi:hypothetical protein